MGALESNVTIEELDRDRSRSTSALPCDRVGDSVPDSGGSAVGSSGGPTPVDAAEPGAAFDGGDGTTSPPEPAGTTESEEALLLLLLLFEMAVGGTTSC